MMIKNLIIKDIHLILLISLTVFFLSIFSCNNSVILSAEKKINSGVWNKKEKIELEANIFEINKLFNIYIDMDIHEDFLTNNFWIFAHTKAPSGNMQSDTIMYYISDEKGKWYGNKSGDIINNKFLYKSNIKFAEAGEYKFTLLHGMRNNDLPKIFKIGIIIEEQKSETLD